MNVYFPITFLFILSAAWALFALFHTSGRSKLLVLIAVLRLFLQGAASLSGFYFDTQSLPPRLLFLTLPPLTVIILTLLLPVGRKVIKNLDTKWLLLLSLVRIPVEIGLLLLYNKKLIPELMTFEGRNPDIFAGISVIFIYILYKNKYLSNSVLLLWNILSVILLLNIIITANLSSPTPLQQFGWNQPNVAFRYFPVVFLPSFIAPAVLFSHLAIFMKLAAARHTFRTAVI